MTINRVQQLADTYFDYFQTIVKVDNREYVVVKDLQNKAPYKLLDSVFGCANYNQTTISMVHSALSVISECSDLDNVELNLVTTHCDLMNWLNDDYERSEYVNYLANDRREGGQFKEFNLFDVMEVAYSIEAYEVLYDVIAYLKLELKCILKGEST